MRQPTARLVERQRNWAELGRLLLEGRPESGRPDQSAARVAFRKAVACAELLREQFRDDRQRRRVQQGNLEVYERLIEVCVDLWEVEREPTALAEAVETAEKSRARRLMELLAHETLRPANTPSDLEAELQALRDRLQRAMLRLQHEAGRPRGGEDSPAGAEQSSGSGGSTSSARGGPDLQALQADVDRVEAAYRDVVRRVRVHDPEFNPDKPVVPVDADTALGLLPRDLPTAIVQYSVTPRRGLALVITEAGIEHVPLAGLDVSRVTQSVLKWYEGYYETCRIDGRLDSEAWSDFIASILQSLGRQVMQPVVERLNGIRRLILVPNRALHVLPLHACSLDNGSLVGDTFEVVYAPVCRSSIAALNGPVRSPTNSSPSRTRPATWGSPSPSPRSSGGISPRTSGGDWPRPGATGSSITRAGSRRGTTPAIVGSILRTRSHPVSSWRTWLGPIGG